MGAPLSFQRLILTLHDYWSSRGCVILQPFDTEVGAGTLHPATVLRALGPKPWSAAYVADGKVRANVQAAQFERLEELPRDEWPAR